MQRKNQPKNEFGVCVVVTRKSIFRQKTQHQQQHYHDQQQQQQAASAAVTRTAFIEQTIETLHSYNVRKRQNKLFISNRNTKCHHISWKSVAWTSNSGWYTTKFTQNMCLQELLAERFSYNLHQSGNVAKAKQKQ